MGYPECQLVALLGESRMPAFEQYIELKAHPTCSGSDPCSEPHGPVFYVHDVGRFIEG